MEDADGSVSLAWAIEVKATQLGAHLEAYVVTKAAITTLKACMAHSKGSSMQAMSKVPLEVTEMIADALKESTYRDRIPHWLRGQKCTAGKCSPGEHLTGSKLQDFLCNGGEDKEMDDIDPDNPIEDEILENHQRTMEDYLRKIGALTNYPTGRASFRNQETRTFERSIKIFTDDFGITSRFSIKGNFDATAPLVSDAETTAHLAEPVFTAPLYSEPGPNHASYVVRSVIDRTALIQSLSDDPSQRFKNAVKALGLDNPHTRSMREIPHWTEDSSSRKSTRSDGLAARTDIANKEQPLALESQSFDDQKSNGNENVSVEERMCSENGSCYHHSSDGTLMKYVPTREWYCNDCGEEDCAGAFEMTEPKLMMLGFGELRAWPAPEFERHRCC
ncbi:MAG: hypothetical protein Q9174_005304 [Haloplaca sp. 1 TL-2023]